MVPLYFPSLPLSLPASLPSQIQEHLSLVPSQSLVTQYIRKSLAKQRHSMEKGSRGQPPLARGRGEKRSQVDGGGETGTTTEDHKVHNVRVRGCGHIRLVGTLSHPCCCSMCCSFDPKLCGAISKLHKLTNYTEHTSAFSLPPSLPPSLQSEIAQIDKIHVTYNVINICVSLSLPLSSPSPPLSFSRMTFHPVLSPLSLRSSRRLLHQRPPDK